MVITAWSQTTPANLWSKLQLQPQTLSSQHFPIYKTGIMTVRVLHVGGQCTNDALRVPSEHWGLTGIRNVGRQPKDSWCQTGQGAISHHQVRNTTWRPVGPCRALSTLSFQDSEKIPSQLFTTGPCSAESNGRSKAELEVDQLHTRHLLHSFCSLWRAM